MAAPHSWMRARLGLLLLLLVAACKGGGDDRAEPAAALDVPALLDEGRRLAESTWPDARLSGIRIGEEVVPGTRKQSYAVRLAIDFERDPDDPTAKSAAIVCSRRCYAPGCEPAHMPVLRTGGGQRSIFAR